MLQVILEQKIALATYAIEYGGVQQLTAAQLDLAGKVVKVLGCVEEITKSMSTETASTIATLSTGVFLVLFSGDHRQVVNA